MQFLLYGDIIELHRIEGVINMNKFIPYEKLSKKCKREMDLKKRRTWNSVNPATKIANSNKKKYMRHAKDSSLALDE